MYKTFIEKIDNLYGNDKKKLRTGTILYGNLYEDRWQTNIQKPLSIEELNSLELEVGKLPKEYKDFLLTSNGCYLFDLLRIAGKQDGYKGMSIEEQIHQPISQRNIVPYMGKKKLDEDLFVFADSMETGSFFAFNKEEKIIQMNMRNFKTLNIYQTLIELLEEVFIEGKRMVLSKEYIE